MNEDTQGRKLVAPLDYCGACLRRHELHRERHDENGGAVRERQLRAASLADAFEHFQATTGVDLKGFIVLESGIVTIEPKDIRALADELLGTEPQARDLPGSPRTINGPALAAELQAAPMGTVIRFARRPV